MPKKRHTNLFSKPPSSVHHSATSSLTGGRSSAAARASDHEEPKSVNELLKSLRATNITPSTDNRGGLPVIAPSMPTPIRQLLDLPETPAPRPRLRARIGPDGRRLPAGPAPPNSWLGTSIYAPARNSGPADEGGARLRGHIDTLPGVEIPRKHSLLDIVLRKISRNWEFHKEYDQYYLSALTPTTMRELLFSYIASYGPEAGLDFTSLQRILQPEDPTEEFAGNDDLQRLDFSGSLGHGIRFKHLRDLISSAPTSTENSDQESWDTSPASISRGPTMKITNLRYLSLAHPNAEAPLWAPLLKLAPLLPTLTHLSLAYWPTPELTPNSKTTTMHSNMTRPQNYGATGFYSHNIDQDWSEAAGILRRLSTSLYSLEWLDLDGNSEWVRALRWSKTAGIDWVGKWGRVQTLNLRSGINLDTKSKDPGPFSVSKQNIIAHKHRVVEAMEVAKWVNQLRGWITVQYDDFEKYDEFLESTEHARVLNRGIMSDMRRAWANEGSEYERRLRSSWDDVS